MSSFNILVDDIVTRLPLSGGKITTLGIDGPTAAGKTSLANAIRDRLETDGVPCSVFRLDWTLKNRASRAQDLEHLRKEPFGFEHEAELHMNLVIAENTLKKITSYNQDTDSPYAEIMLQSLYNRDDEGNLSGEERIPLQNGMVVIFEGHYTLRNELDKHLDLNVLLLASHDELLGRKIRRVKEYRDADATEDYFWRIDVPSFRNHLVRFGSNADLVIDNTDYTHPRTVKDSSVQEWTGYVSAKILSGRPLVDTQTLGDFVLSTSLFAPNDLKQALQDAIAAIRQWDQRANQYLRINIQSVEADLTEFAQNIIQQLNDSSTKYSFKLMHQDSLHNVYYRRLPFSLSIGIFEQDGTAPVVSILADVFQSELAFQIIWSGGYKRLSIRRELGEIVTIARSAVKDLTTEMLYNPHNDEAFSVWLPTDFTLPPFLRGHEYRLVYIRKENEVVAPTQMLGTILRDTGVWIQRFALFSELHFFADALNKIGIHNVKVGNYLVCVNHHNTDLLKDFFDFAQEWTPPLAKAALFEQSAHEMDSIIVIERQEAKAFVETQCPRFSVKDGYLFSEFLYGDDVMVREGLSQLKRMLRAKNRIVRKRAIEFITKCFPLLELPTNELWDNLPKDARKTVYLEEFTRLSPSVLAEVYLWLSIRKERSSILGCNIYDVRERSIDSRAYLEAAGKNGVPIILQGSLNALGQLEIDEQGVANAGYLKLSNGPIDFITAVMNSARDLYLTEGVLPPLFGIGLDHVSSKYDNPKGRAKRFLKLSADTGFLTHYVPDGEGLYDSSGMHENPYHAMAKFSADLKDNLKEQYIIDREVCAGELNYVDKVAKVQSSEDMRLFMSAYQDALKERGHLALLSRPMLFIGNLGTTHHGKDTSTPPVETSIAWREALKNENFVSCVLHGTTNTHKGVLYKAADGCHKINLAGEFLGTIVDNLPEHISRIIYDSDVEPKKMMAAVRPVMNKTPTADFAQLHQALVAACDNFITTVNSPHMTTRDSAYFQHCKYVFSEEQATAVIHQIQNSLEQYRSTDTTDDMTRNNAFAASMIEVPEEEMEEYLETLWNSGIRHFHIDAGDGKLIPREFTGVRKAARIRELYPEATMNAHLMIENPHFPKRGEPSAIEQYARAGCNAIAVHLKAFSSKQELFNALSLIRNLGCNPGIVIETSDTFDSHIEDIILEAQLNWVVVMGVPIGYGGQLFQIHALQTISKLRAFFMKERRMFTIEADGGLTMQTLQLCMNVGADIFAGWSIVKAKDQDTFEKNILRVNAVLKKQ